MRPATLALCALAGLLAVSSAAAQQTPDPFEVVRGASGSEVLVPPRALAVIPERHTARRLRMIDQLSRVEPQFDDLARGAGLNATRAIQLRTREANIPIFVAKTDAAVSTVLQLELGARIELRGVLIERGGRYMFIASSVRRVPGRRTR